VKFCEKCSRMIHPGEPCTSYDKLSTSAAGLTVHMHKVCPIPPRR
jgi:hypothetical protein